MTTDSDGDWATAELLAEGLMQTCHLLVHNLHADMSSATVEIYASS